MGDNNGIQVGGNADFTDSNIATGVNTTAWRGDKQQQAQEKVMPILLVFANPPGTPALESGEEERIIRESILLSGNSRRIELTVLHEARIRDLSQALLHKDFELVHLCGHGTEAGCLLLIDDRNRTVAVPMQTLLDLFNDYQKTLRCVVLNFCYSLLQGKVITEAIRYAVAIDSAVHTKTAHEFARSFYYALGVGKDIEIAYGEGCRNVRNTLPDAVFASRLLTR